MIATLADTFRDEAAELLAELEVGLVTLESNPSDPEQVHAVFRLLHTLKGSSAMVGYDAFAVLAHELEAIFEQVRSGALAASTALISRTLAGSDLLRLLLAADASAPAPAVVDHYIADLHRATGSGSLAAPVVRDNSKSNSGIEQLYLLRFTPAADILQRGLDPRLLLDELFALGSGVAVARTAAIPSLESLDPECCHLGWDLLLATTADAEVLRDIFVFVEDDSELCIQQLPVPAGASARSLLESGRALLAGADGGGAELLTRLLVPRQEQVVTPPAAPVVALESANIRVKAGRLDSLVNLIGELVTVQARLSRAVATGENSGMEAIAEEVERLTSGLRDEVLTLRMVPIGGTFGRLQRLVRDLASQLDKEIDLVVEGAETELDKTLIDGLQDPLLHLVRNCIDHGIEAPALRQTAGKPRRGTIRVSAAHSGAQVLITISDDGAGVDRERIVRRAQQLGLMEVGATCTEREAFQLIFAPGFSTAEAVTSISGRGVGMDVVQRSIARLRGRIEVHSSVGAGTSFVLRLPLTLAIIDGLLVELAGDQFVLPLDAVEECVELHRDQRGERLIIDLRGAIVPFIDLRDHFELSGMMPEIATLVIVRAEGERVGLLVDRVLGDHQTVVKPLKTGMTCHAACSGATILGDGRVALILDVPRLVESVAANELLLTGS